MLLAVPSNTPPTLVEVDLDLGNGIAVDSCGNAYITGLTGSIDFPTVNAIQGYKAGCDDAFVTKIGVDGDTTPPTTTASPTGGTYSSAQTVDLNCIDTCDSGCQTTYYCLGSECTTMTPYTGAINISSSTTLRFYSKDNANNSESIKTESYTIDIDTVAPMTTAIPSSGTYSSAQNVILTCNDGGGSGCQKTYYCLDHLAVCQYRNIQDQFIFHHQKFLDSTQRTMQVIVNNL